MTVKYYCYFPNCSYEASSKALIDEHHILPKALGGSNKASNLITLCPSHHRRIYCREATEGFHSIIHEDSIEILGKLSSSNGLILHYVDLKEGVEKYYSLRTRKILD